MPDLAALRAELDRVDRGLLDAAQRRAEIVRDIGAAKRGADGGTRALFDRERERAVYARTEAYAREIGLDPRVARQIMETLVEASHEHQESVAINRSTEVKSILIVGGLGRMGRRLAQSLLARGHEVDAFDTDDPRDAALLVPKFDVVLLAVPMTAQEACARAIGPLLRDDALLCDINSLKGDICAAMEASFAGEVLGLHPMFGPSVATLRRQKFVACPRRRGPLTGWMIREIEQMGGEVIETDAVQHDRMMALVQVLVHLSTLVMGEALRASSDELGVALAESLQCTSPIYRLELAFVGRLFAQNPELYAEIVMTNPHGLQVHQQFAAAAERYREILERGDRDAFASVYDGCTSFFSAFADDAMNLSDEVIDAMVKRP